MVGPSRKHVRTGCQVCKKRHLKCDETTPSCRQCTSAGWKCEYLAPAPIIRRRARQSPLPESTCNQYRPSVAVTSDLTDLTDFHYFQDATEHESYACIGAHSWTRIALQLSFHEPAVRYAVYALGSLLKESISHHSQPTGADLACPGRMLHHYNQSITRLSSGISTTPLPKRVTLVLCLAFVWIELLRDNVDQAITHCRGGLSIISNMSESPGEGSIEPCLLQAFTRLHAQIHLHGNPKTKLEVSDSLELPVDPLPPSFNNIDDVRDHLENISLSSLHSMRRLKQLNGGSARIPQDWTSPELFSITCGIGRQKYALGEWHQAFTKLSVTDPNPNLQKSAALGLLEIQYITQSLLQACLDDTSEMIFDTEMFEVGFERIVALADDFLSGQKQKSNFQLTMDSGLLPPLFFTSLKCRIPWLRTKAIELMRLCPHREGLWSRGSLVQIAEWKACKEGLDVGMPASEMRISRETAQVVEGADQCHVVARYTQGTQGGEVMEVWDERIARHLASMSDMI